MSKFTSLIRRAPKRLSAVALIVAAAIIIPAATFAWGPNRETFSVKNNVNSDHVQFNSYTDNENVGDERNFVGVREKGSANTWYDNMNVQSGKTYIVRMYVHNNAATSLGLTAKDVTAKVNLPTTTGKSVDVMGFVNASNVGEDKNGNKGKFAEVYDDAKLTSTQNFNVAYVSGSLKYENNAGTFALPESIFTQTGAKLGYDKMDGNIPGCFQYSGYVSFEVKPQFETPSTYDFSKLVSKHGENKWVESYNAKPGETVDYLLQYKNTSKAAQQDEVTFRDTLPAGMTYDKTQPTTWGNAQHSAGVKAVTGENITNGTGINVGSYAAGANAWLIFSAKVAANDNLPTCGTNTLVNTGKVNTEGTSISDTANVVVTKECKPPVKITVCELSTKKIVTIDEKDFNTSKYSKDLNDCKEKPPVTITVCELATKKIVTINEKDFDASKHSKNLDDCKTPEKINVCELSTKTIVSIDEKDFDSAKYSKNLDDCKTTPPATIVVCDLTSKQTVTINESDFDASKYSKDLNACKETPTTPPELPHTGMSENIVAIVGLGALIASIAYYAASRRALNQ